MNLAIMQPCYLPWRGYFALMKRCDQFVHLDDVPLPRGRSYQTRTAIKTATGRQWLSLPVKREPDQLICEAHLQGDAWSRKHLATIKQELPSAAKLIAPFYENSWTHLATLNIALAEHLARTLGIVRPTHRSGELQARGGGSEKILNLCKILGATRYLTGHGGRAYLDHKAFEANNIEVVYLDYDLTPYPQPHGEFDPYLSVLDALAHADDPASTINAELIPWRDFLAQPV